MHIICDRNIVFTLCGKTTKVKDNIKEFLKVDNQLEDTLSQFIKMTQRNFKV